MKTSYLFAAGQGKRVNFRATLQRNSQFEIPHDFIDFSLMLQCSLPRCSMFQPRARSARVALQRNSPAVRALNMTDTLRAYRMRCNRSA